MPATSPTVIRIRKGIAPTFVLRVESFGVPIVRAQVGSFTLYVYEMPSTTPPEPVAIVGPLPPEIGFYDALQFDAKMSLLTDSKGYNFAFTLGLTDFEFKGGKLYQVEIVAQMSGVDSEYCEVFHVDVGERFS